MLGPNFNARTGRRRKAIWSFRCLNNDDESHIRRRIRYVARTGTEKREAPTRSVVLHTHGECSFVEQHSVGSRQEYAVWGLQRVGCGVSPVGPLHNRQGTVTDQKNECPQKP